jgi:hypothetical protein
LRMRRFYVGPMCRRLAIGRTIAMMLLDRAQVSASLVALNAAPNSFCFWEALGFISDIRAGHTHIWRRGDQLSSTRDQDCPGYDEGGV